MTTWAVLSSALLVGLLGGIHCAAMCGGLLMAIEQKQGERVAVLRRSSPWSLARESLVLHAGRLSTYGLLGALVGGVGAGAWRQQWLPIQRGLFLTGGVLLCVYGLSMLARAGAGQRRAWRLGQLELGLAALVAGARRRVATHVPASLWSGLRRRPVLQRYLTGLAWGTVPCAMTMSMLALALLAGSASAGATVMLVFGLGTLPNLLVMSGALAWLRLGSRQPGWRRAGGATVLLFGGITVFRALVLPDTLSAEGFCLLW